MNNLAMFVKLGRPLEVLLQYQPLALVFTKVPVMEALAYARATQHVSG